MPLRDPVRNVPPRPVTVALVAGSLLLGIPMSPAVADVAITAQQAITVQQAAGAAQTPPNPQTITLFYKGRDARLETAGGPVLLYDGKAGIIHTLDTAHKTYYTTLFTQVQQAGAPIPSGTGRQVKQDTKLDLRQTDQAKTIAGVTAHQYVLTGTITFTPSQPQGYKRGGGGRGGGGHRRGGGGFPGGGFPGGFPLVGSATVDQNGGGYGGYGGRGGGTLALPQWSLSGELWLSDTLKFPAKEDTLPAAQLVAASAGPFLQPLADALDKHKGLPLLARITVTRTPPSSGGRTVDQFGGIMEGTPTTPAAPPAPTTTATTLTVQSLSSAPLDDKLFQTPLDYTLIPPPQDPFVPGAPTPAPAP